jgi:hypothetical protein
VNDAPYPIVTVHRLTVPVRHADDIVERLRQFLPEAAADLDGLDAVSLFRAVAFPDIAIVAHWRDQAARAGAAARMSTHPTLVGILREANAGEMETYQEIETIQLGE